MKLIINSYKVKAPNGHIYKLELSGSKWLVVFGGIFLNKELNWDYFESDGLTRCETLEEAIGRLEKYLKKRFDISEKIS